MSVWVDSRQLCEELQVNYRMLAKYRNEPNFKQGRHWRNVAPRNSSRPTYRYNLDACSRYFDIPVERR